MLSSPPPTIIAQHYSLTDLGTLGGPNSFGNGINASGQVTGYANKDASARHAFLYSNGSMQDLGTLGGGDSFGNAINVNGQVTGYAYTLGNSVYHAFLYGSGPMQDLGTLGGNSNTVSAGLGINDAGQVTGYSDTTGDRHAFVTKGTTLTDLYLAAPIVGCGSLGNGFTLSGSTNVGTSINASGQVAGYAQAPINGLLESQGFVIDNGTTLTTLGTLGGSENSANGINTSGIVTGYADIKDDKAHHAFRSINGAMEDLGTLGGTHSSGEAINASGQVTGKSQLLGDGSYHAFLYTNGSMNDLNDLDLNSSMAKYVTLMDATAINDSSWIVANGFDSRTAQMHAYLLTPVSPVLSAALRSTAVDGAGNYSANIVITNTGTESASGAELTTGGLVVSRGGRPITTLTSTALPAVQGNLMPGASATITLTFPALAGAPGTAAALRWSLVYSTGSASGTLRLTLP